MPLVQQADVEKYGQVDFTAEPDAAVTLWIATATKAIETYCGRLFEADTGRVETLETPHPDTTDIRLVGYPVTGVTSVVEDGTALTVAEDFFWYEDGRLVRTVDGLYDTTWTNVRQGIVVTYDYGWAVGDVPDDVRMAAAQIVLRLFNAGAVWANSPTGAAGGLTAISLDGVGSASWDAAAGGSVRIGEIDLISPVERALLAPYLRRI